MMNNNLLKGKIIEKGLSLKEFSAQTGIKKAALYRKLSGKTEFSRLEIEKMIDVLNLSPIQIGNIFFSEKVS